MSSLALDAEALYAELRRGVRALITPQTRLVGIVSGGQWLAERLQADLGLAGAPGAISSAMHRDDFAKRGLAASGPSPSPAMIPSTNDRQRRCGVSCRRPLRSVCSTRSCRSRVVRQIVSLPSQEPSTM